MAIWPLSLMADANVPVPPMIFTPALSEKTKAWPELFVPTTSPAWLMPSVSPSPDGPKGRQKVNAVLREHGCADANESSSEQVAKQTTSNHERTLLKNGLKYTCDKWDSN
jgi:hypothetical protein